MTQNAHSDTQKVKWTWGGFWLRLKSRKVGERDGDALFWRVFIPLGFVSYTGLIFVDTECEAGNWSIDVVLTYLWPAFVIIGWALVYRIETWQRHWGWRVWFSIAPLLLGWIAAYTLMGWAIWANALTASGAPMQIVGPVIDQKKGQTRFTGFDYFLTIEFEGRPVCLNVTQDEYRSHPIGSVYGREMRRGGFGYFYELEYGAVWK